MRNLHHLRRFVDRQSTEEPQLDDPALIGIDLRQSIQNIVKRQNVRFALRAKSTNVFLCYIDSLAPALCSIVGACVIDQDAPH